ncbi:MAG: hypothetical protein A2068_01145 [Ignavibacteria bacterium GWB2_35_6b]|nr:MAG: hypothetical protein A2068_01145 [Ignavibacteria bacterium GWB2_35_6b]
MRKLLQENNKVMNEEKQKAQIDKNKKFTFKTHYSSLGWLLYSIGMSAQPIKVDFIDPETGHVVGSTTDPVELKKYVGR